MHSTPPPDRKEWACDLLSLVPSAHKREGFNSGLSCGPATQYTKIKESCLLPELIVLWHYQIQQRCQLPAGIQYYVNWKVYAARGNKG